MCLLLHIGVWFLLVVRLVEVLMEYLPLFIGNLMSQSRAKARAVALPEIGQVRVTVWTKEKDITRLYTLILRVAK